MKISSIKFRIVLCGVLPGNLIVDRRFRGAYRLSFPIDQPGPQDAGINVILSR
jgi:hypothetical protein